MNKKTVIGAAQMCSGISSQENLEEIARLAKEAASRGVKYLLTPEMSVAFAENFEQLAEIVQPFSGNEALVRCAEIARENSLFLHIGSLAIAAENSSQIQASGKPFLCNRSVLFNPNGDIVDYYDKIHLFDAELDGDRPYRESRYYLAGDRAVSAEMGKIRLGMSICYDLRFASLYRQLAQAGAQIISIPSAFTVATGRAHWEILLRARAIESGCYIVAAAQGGAHENGRETYGHSMIVDPWGEIVTELKGDETGLISAEIDLDKVQQVRNAVPALKNNAQFCLSINHNGLGS